MSKKIRSAISALCGSVLAVLLALSPFGGGAIRSLASYGTLDIYASNDGSSVTVSVYFVNSAGLRSFDFYIDYDASMLTYQKCSAGGDARAVSDSASPMTETPNGSYYGRVRIAGYFQEALNDQYYSGCGVNADNFCALTITLNVNSGVYGDTYISGSIVEAKGLNGMGVSGTSVYVGTPPTERTTKYTPPVNNYTTRAPATQAPATAATAAPVPEQQEPAAVETATTAATEPATAATAQTTAAMPTADPYGIVWSGTCSADGSDLAWSLDRDGLLSVTGTGFMKDYEAGTAPWYKERSYIRSVSIGEGVQNIGSYAFFFCTGAQSLSLPSTLTGIGANAFSSCVSLPGAVIPGSVSSVGAAAFSACKALTNVTLSPSMTAINDNTFACCTALASVDIPASVTQIGSCAFASCSALRSAALPAGLTGIGDRAFFACDSLTSAVLPAAVTDVGSGVFGGCAALVSITVAFGSASLSSDGTALYDSGKTKLIQYPGAGAASVTLPDTVTAVDDDAFIDCRALTSAALGSSLVSIGKNAFNGCSALVSVTMPKTLNTVSDYSFLGCASLTAAYYAGGKSGFGGVTVGSGNDKLTGCLKYGSAN